VFRGRVAKLGAVVVVALLTGTVAAVLAAGPSHAPAPRQESAGLSLAVSIHDTIPVGKTPDGGAYDSKNFQVYVSNQKSNNVTVISSITHTHTSIAVGVLPTNSSSVSIISNASKVIATLKLGSGAKPTAAYVDPANADVLIINESSYPKTNVAWLISGQTNKATKITLGLGFAAVVGFNPKSKELYVANDIGHSLSAITATGTVKTIALPGEPFIPTPDPATGDLLVPMLATTLKGGGSIEVLSATDAVVTTIKLPGVYSILAALSAYDPYNHDVYFVGHNITKNDSAVVIITSSNKLAATLFLNKNNLDFLPFYDPANGDVYLGGTSKNITVINQTKVVKTLTVKQPVPYLVYDPSLKDMVGAGDVNVTTNSTLFLISSTNTVSAPLTVGKLGIAFLYNPKDKYVWVVNEGSSDLQLVG